MDPSIPLFSIITVCLNEPQLERTCESIVNQTFQGFEWIVIDGGSNDTTLEIFDKYKSRINYFVSEPDGGIYFGMNHGIKKSQGAWIQFLNAGDCFSQNTVLESVSKFIVEYSKYVDVIYGNYVISDGQYFRIMQTPEITNKDSLFNKMTHHETCFFKKILFEKYGPYDTSYRILADWAFALTLCAKHQCKFCKIDLPILLYDQYGASSMNKEIVFRELEDIRSCFFTPEEILTRKRKQALQVCKLLREKIRLLLGKT